MAVDAPGTDAGELGQRRAMAATAPFQFARQFVMPAPDVVRFQQLFIEISLQVQAAPDSGDEHVQLDMLPKQVLAAHQARVDHPHAHQGWACLRARAPMSLR
jgi:hypothetical protein